MPIVQPKLSKNQPLQENGEDSSNLSIFKETLLVEARNGSLHIEVPQPPNENQSMLAVVQIPLPPSTLNSISASNSREVSTYLA